MSNPLPQSLVSTSSQGPSTGPFITYISDRDPTVSDINFQPKQRWLNTTNQIEWFLLGFTTTDSITSANWIDLGNASQVATSYVEDSGVAIPSLGILQIKGTAGANISTIGTSNIVTIGITGTTNHTIQIGNSTGSLTSLGILTNGQLAIGSTGANPVPGNITSNGGTIQITNGPGSLNLETISAPYFSLTPYIVGQAGDIHAQFTGSTAIQDAITASTGPANIYIKPGTYTGNLILKNNINLVSLCPDSVIIVGSISDNGVNPINCSFVNIEIRNNGDYAIGPGVGSNFSFYNCRIIATNHVAIHCQHVDANLFFYQCNGDLQDVGPFFNIDFGKIWFFGGFYDNTFASTQTSDLNQAAIFIAKDATFLFPMTTAAGASFGLSSDKYIVQNCTFETSALNITPIATAGTASNDFHNCIFSSGTATAISVGAGNRILLNNASIDTTNVTAISGAGTLKYGGVLFTDTGRNITVTTQIPLNFVSFSARKSANTANATGDGTTFTIICDTVINNIGAGYNPATGVFTAPALPSSGLYCFTCLAAYEGIGALHTIGLVEFANHSFDSNPANMAASSSTGLSLNYTQFVQMNAGDTIAFTTSIAGSTKTVSVQGGAGVSGCFISGFLVGSF